MAMQIEPHRKKILIVDQDEFLVRIYASRLENAGYDPYFTTDVDQLRGLLAGEQLALALIEPMTSGGNRFDLIADIKKNDEIPVIVLTKLSRPEEIEQATRAGADFYMLKTQVSFKEVIDKIRELVG
ncbi:MAG: response regulator [Patescibacteria group bacterium]